MDDLYGAVMLNVLVMTNKANPGDNGTCWHKVNVMQDDEEIYVFTGNEKLKGLEKGKRYNLKLYVKDNKLKIGDFSPVLNK